LDIHRSTIALTTVIGRAPARAMISSAVRWLFAGATVAIAELP
jgi:hypothetical protein